VKRFGFVNAILSLTCVAVAQVTPELKPYVKIEAPRIALTHVRVIDGTGAAARENQEIVIANGKIESMGATASAEPADVKVIDLTGYTVIPGLVGMHDHLFYPMGGAIFDDMPYSFPRLYLAAGVTSIRTTGSVEPYTDLELKKAIDAGKLPGPKMHITAPYLEGPGSFSLQMHALTGPEDARNFVNFWADNGATSFKAYNYLTRAELGAAIDAAHKRGLKLTGHLCSIGFHEAAALGIDDLEHGLAVDTEFFPGKKPDVCPDPHAAVADLAKIPIDDTRIKDLISDLVKHHVAVTSTLPVFENFVPGRPPLDQRALEAMSEIAKEQYLANRVRISTTKDSPWPAMFQHEMQFEYAFAKAGGLLLAGEDPTGIGGDLAGYGDQREVELLVEAGFTPLEAISIATKNGAEFLGEADRIGTLAPGKSADLVVIHGDPAKDIHDIEQVDTVFKDGIGYDPKKLADDVRGLVGIR
jgi:imidazolonepropionase-like amidohydrolase